jgi:uncharacterized damage-inducible protein DinB
MSLNTVVRWMSPMLLVLSAIPFGAAHAADAPPAGIRGEILAGIKDAEDKLLQLAEATPEEKYSYRPSKDSRSTGEVFMHVASGNYFLANFAGVKPPEGINPEKYESSLTKKADIQKALKDSFEHINKALVNFTDADLDKPAEFFGRKSTVRGAYLLLLSHSHEHLGQSIAYARGNGIVPPWTAARQAAAAAKEQQGKKPEGTPGKKPEKTPAPKK